MLLIYYKYMKELSQLNQYIVKIKSYLFNYCLHLNLSKDFRHIIGNYRRFLMQILIKNKVLEDLVHWKYPIKKLCIQENGQLYNNKIKNNTKMNLVKQLIWFKSRLWPMPQKKKSFLKPSNMECLCLVHSSWYPHLKGFLTK